MALKVTLETLDDVQEELKPFYTETEGGYVLQVEGVDNHPEVKNLKNAYTAEKAKRAEAQDKLRDALAKLEAKPAPTAKDEAEMVRLREELEAKLSEKDAKISEYERKVYGLTVESQLDAAIREVGIAEPAYQKAAKKLLADMVKLVDDRPVVDTDMGPVPLSEHVKRWANGEGAAFVSKPQGGGAKGSERGATKTMSRADFEALDQAKRMAVVREGIAITD